MSQGRDDAPRQKRLEPEGHRDAKELPAGEHGIIQPWTDRAGTVARRW